MRSLLQRLFRRSASPPPRAPRPYRVRLLYTELVRGRPRCFQHELRVDAPDEAAARARATEHFHGLARESWVGWVRRLEDVEVLVDGAWRPGAAPAAGSSIRRRLSPPVSLGAGTEPVRSGSREVGSASGPVRPSRRRQDAP
jgi:hypothetical protein